MDTREVMRRLAEPFPAAQVKWLPKSVKGNRCLGMPYVDARLVQDRLDEVLGIDGWMDDYQVLPDGSTMCFLSVRLDTASEVWIKKVDVGSPSEQPDGGDRTKAAFSDALKRTAVKFGVARYIYRLPPFWCDYDGSTKKVIPPRLPDWALPGKAVTPPVDHQYQDEPAKKAKAEAPATGEELLSRLRKKEAAMVAEGGCQPGALVAYIAKAGEGAGYGGDIAQWNPAVTYAFAGACLKAFEVQCKKAQAQAVVTPPIPAPPPPPKPLDPKSVGATADFPFGHNAPNAAPPAPPPSPPADHQVGGRAMFAAYSDKYDSMTTKVEWDATNAQVKVMAARRELTPEQIDHLRSKAGRAKARIDAGAVNVSAADVPFLPDAY